MGVHNNHNMPGHYKGIINQINGLIEEGNKALGHPDKYSCVQALIFKEELLELHGRVAFKQGEINDRIVQLQNTNPKAYQKYEAALKLLGNLYKELNQKILEWDNNTYEK